MWYEREVAYDIGAGIMIYVFVDHSGHRWEDHPFLDGDGFQLRSFWDTDGKEIKEDFSNFRKA